MEENNPVINVETMPWSRLIILTGLMGLIFAHTQGYELALPMLCLFVTVFSWTIMYQQWRLYNGSFSVALTALMNDVLVLEKIASINPYSMGLLTEFAVKAGVGFYLYTQELYLFTAIAIAPNVVLFFLYQRLLNYINSPDMLEIAQENMRQIEKQKVIDGIFQEEMNAVIEGVAEKANKRIKEIYPEDYEDEQRSESDSEDQ